jgi:hypothetical protein
MVGAQHAVAQAVEGADPHASGVDGQEGLQARHHFAGGFVGERHREDGGGRGQALLDEPGDAGDQDTGFAAACAGQNQCRFVGERYRGVLFGIQVEEEFGHFPVVGGGSFVIIRFRVGLVFACGGLGLLVGCCAFPARDKALIHPTPHCVRRGWVCTGKRLASQ